MITAVMTIEIECGDSTAQLPQLLSDIEELCAKRDMPCEFNDEETFE
jgi:hypothetical protein